MGSLMPRVGSGQLVVRIAAIAGGYFLASEIVTDELASRAFHIPHDGVLHLGVHFGLAVLAAIVGWRVIVRPLQREAAGEQLLSSLHRGLEMADTPAQAVAVFGRVLSSLTPNGSSQLLLADSSDAHLEEALRLSAEHGSPCSVDSPRACPAVKCGQTLVFSSSRAIDACPRLADRPEGPCSAVCLPISVLGKTIGILHVSGADSEGAGPEEVGTLRQVAGEIGTRLGMIRAIAQSELQATTDPLTGLLNRRKLDDKARELGALAVPFTVAMIDLDHLKTINDTHGHQIGDRSLHLFARTLTETIREQDLASRYGGDEFVVLLPRCSLDKACEIIERLRQALKDAAIAAGLPTLTFSAGLADSTTSFDFDGILAAADKALFQAKASGRDRLADTRTPQLALA